MLAANVVTQAKVVCGGGGDVPPAGLATKARLAKANLLKLGQKSNSRCACSLT